jgi:L-aminopeptidase/D-esterase-like protein
MVDLRPGGGLTDVPGVRVGHHRRASSGWRTGTTVVLVPGGATGGVDVRGGGPGTRETDLLRPENLVHQVHAVALTGGSAYGLSVADGVMALLRERGVGFPVGDGAGEVVPIVPTAVIFDLGRGGRFDHHPDASFGRAAARHARAGNVGEGAVGAGTGAVAGTLQGGVGTCSATLPDGTVVASLAVVNAAGLVVDPATGLPWMLDGVELRRPSLTDRRRLREHLDAAAAAATRPLNTTIGVVATSARLSKAECTKLAAVAHDGLARAVRPSHSMFDGDTVFALATGQGELVEPAGDERFRSSRGRAAAVNRLLDAGAVCFAAACTRAVVTAQAHRGGPPSYRDLCPSAVPDHGAATTGRG